MSIISKLIDAFRPYNHERATANKLAEARMALVEHECAREYHSATCSMLKTRILRLESTSAPQAERKESLSALSAVRTQNMKYGEWDERDAVKPDDWDTRNGLDRIKRAAGATA
jgi:hypothetical protein